MDFCGSVRTGWSFVLDFFYQALSVGPTVAVTVIDKLSVVFTAILAVVVLTEGITLQAGIGLALVVLGTLLVAIPWENSKTFP